MGVVALVSWAGVAALVLVGGSAAAQPSAPVVPQAAASQGSAVTVAQDLANPWGLAFLPGGRFLVTERSGRLRVVEANGRVNAPVSGVPAVVFGGQGGLLDVVTDADFERNRRIFFCFSEAGAKGEAGNSTALASAVLAAGETALSDVRVIFSQRPKVQSSLHFGCRIAQARDGSLFLTLGERSTRKEDAQKLDGYLGKVVHLQPDGSPGPGNPVVAGALPGIWSWGHRNPQGATIAPDGKLWINEHGPQGGDEINVPQAGRNYGWPVVTHGENYGGGKIGEGLAHKEGMEPPLHYWVPSIAPSGMAFLTSDRYGADWRGSLFIGSLKFSRLHRLVVADDKVVRDEYLLSSLGERIRDVRQGPDGWIYLLSDGPQGRLLRLTR